MVSIVSGGGAYSAVRKGKGIPCKICGGRASAEKDGMPGDFFHPAPFAHAIKTREKINARRGGAFPVPAPAVPPLRFDRTWRKRDNTDFFRKESMAIRRRQKEKCLTFFHKMRMILFNCWEGESTLQTRPKRAAEGGKRRRSAEEHGPGACGGKHVQPPPAGPDIGPMKAHGIRA